METQAKHTPTPWSVHKNADGSQRIDGQGLASIAVLSAFFSELQGEQEANAEFIVKACNDYHKMLELLSAAYQKLYIADHLIDPYTEEDGEDIAGQLFSEGLADEIDTFLQNT